jgi:hypothetical protein
VAVDERNARRLVAMSAAAGVPCVQLGVAGGNELAIGMPAGAMRLPFSSLVDAWETLF